MLMLSLFQQYYFLKKIKNKKELFFKKYLSIKLYHIFLRLIVTLIELKNNFLIFLI